MTDELKGFWIFKSHKYTGEEILKSSQYETIISTSGKIASDIGNWQKSGKLDFSTKVVYNVNRDFLEDRLIDLDVQIKKREPTWWESVKTFFAKIINYIRTVLPRLIFKFLADVAEGKGFIADGAKKLLKVTQKIQRTLISEKNVYIDKM
jgi:hypothetical protein